MDTCQAYCTDILHVTLITASAQQYPSLSPFRPHHPQSMVPCTRIYRKAQKVHRTSTAVIVHGMFIRGHKQTCTYMQTRKGAWSLITIRVCKVQPEQCEEATASNSLEVFNRYRLLIDEKQHSAIVMLRWISFQPRSLRELANVEANPGHPRSPSLLTMSSSHSCFAACSRCVHIH